MGFSVDVGVSAAAVFAQGLLSFFSPCVLPLLPLYLGYLSGGAAQGSDESGGRKRARVFLNTLCFVLGVSFAIFLLGMGMTLVGSFFGENRALFARIGGVLVILFGLYQLGVFGSSQLLSAERRLPLRLDKMAMSPWTALLMGFVFSFAWTPCVGPMLSGVLLMAAGAASRQTGFLLLGVYTLGFCLPFLALGVFTTELLEKLRAHRDVAKYTAKLGGALLILMGVMMLTGWMSSLASGLSRVDGGEPASREDAVEPASSEPAADEAADAQEDTEPVAAPDFTLTDQYGAAHTLSDYRGKVVFLNFWATWCPPCRAEMPDIQSLYEAYGDAEDAEVVILAVAAPGLGRETDEAGVTAFLSENGYTYPVVMDPTGDVLRAYGISAFPTTFMIDAEGSVFGYVPGAMSREIMQSIIDQTVAGVRS